MTKHNNGSVESRKEMDMMSQYETFSQQKTKLNRVPNIWGWVAVK